MSPNSRNVQALTEIPPPKTKKEMQSFLGILNYLSTFSTMTADMCEPLQKLTTFKADWTQNRMHLYLYERAKKIFQKDACMKLYDIDRTPYLETDTSGIGFRPRLLQVRDGMNCRCDGFPDDAILFLTAFASKSLSGTACHYSNIKCKALRTLHGLEKFQHYFFVREVCVVGVVVILHCIN